MNKRHHLGTTGMSHVAHQLVVLLQWVLQYERIAPTEAEGRLQYAGQREEEVADGVAVVALGQAHVMQAHRPHDGLHVRLGLVAGAVCFLIVARKIAFHGEKKLIAR